MRIIDALKKEYIIPNLISETKNEVLKELCNSISSIEPEIKCEELFDVLKKREQLCSTAVDCGVAMPHGKLLGISKIYIGFARSEKGIDYESTDGSKSKIFVLLISPPNSQNSHINYLAKFSKILRNPDFRQKIIESNSRDEIYNLIIKEDEKY